MGLNNNIADHEVERKEYLCTECRTPMEDVDGKVLVCPKCGFSIDKEDWISDPALYDSIVSFVTKYDDPAYQEYGEDYDEIFGDK